MDIHEMIDEYLSERRLSNGGYAEVTARDWALLNEIVRQLVYSKFDPDPEEHYPIDFVLINRNKEYYLGVVVPYAGTEKRLRKAKSLLSKANYLLEEVTDEITDSGKLVDE